MGARRTFWVLAAAAGAVTVGGVGAAVYVAGLTLPCWWAPARAVFEGACGAPFWPFAAYPLLATAALAILLTGWVTLAVRALAGQLTATRRLLGALVARPVPTPDYVSRAAEAAGLSRVVTVDDTRAIALCHGLLRPRLVIATGTLERLDADQVRAVIAHEASHATRRDPLRLLTVRTIAAMLFPFPALGDLADRIALDCEIEADRHAVAATSARSMAAALLAFIDSPRLAWNHEAIAGVDPTHARITHLRDGTGPDARIPRRRIALSLASATALAAITIPAVIADRASDPTYTVTVVTGETIETRTDTP